jgi:DNA modification methylase
MTTKILIGDCIARMADIEPGTVQTCVTSPPYWGLRDYGEGGQHGLEETPEAYVANMVEVFRAVRRCLRDDGTLWLNLGDSYASNSDRASMKLGAHPKGCQCTYCTMPKTGLKSKIPTGLKPKDLVGIPWRVAFALQADGWYLRSDIIWHKPNPMPESVTDRPTKGHEYVFLLSKSGRYFYDADAIREEQQGDGRKRGVLCSHERAAASFRNDGGRRRQDNGTRNKRTVWTITTRPYSGAHFATMPPQLAELCIKAGSKMGDLVLDPYTGAGTTGLVAQHLRRSFVGCELNPDYAALAEKRIRMDSPLFSSVSVDEVKP